MTALLEIRNLRVNFGGFTAVDGVDLDVAEGELLGIVGESGSGKSVSMMALMGLIDAPGIVSADALRFAGQDLLAMKPAQRRRIVGKDIAMVFQDALNSLNPSHTVGDQVREVLQVHLGLRGAALEARVLELFELVEIPGAKQRLGAYPHQMSGGMNQRVMIAMAIACEPRLLIADEPTTALDVTIQAQVMDLLARLQQERGMSLVLITHDLAAVADMGLHVLHIGVLAAGVHHQEDVAEGGACGGVGAHHHQVVEQAAAAVGEEGVALFAHTQIDHVHRHQAFQRGSSIAAHQAHLAHVRDVEERRGLAALLVLGHQAAGVLHRHGIAGKGHQTGAQLLVQGVKRRL